MNEYDERTEKCKYIQY